MSVVLIVFMVIAGLVSIFALAVVISDIVKERKKAPPEEVRSEQNESAATVPPVEEISATPAQEIALTADENAVVFSAGDLQKTLDEKFMDLDERDQRYYVEVVRYAMEQEGAKQFKNTKYEEYKIGKTRLVRLQIRRGYVLCEFVLLNTDFNNYIRNNKVRVKHAPTVLRLDSEAAVEIAKNSIDIAVKAAEEDREYKKQLRKEKRRLARIQNAASTEK